MSDLNTKKEGLYGILRRLDSLAIAFSGGVDSALLLACAKQVIKGKITAITCASSIHKKREIMDAKDIAQQLGIEHILIDTSELSEPDFVQNGPDRCYHCKRLLFKNISEIAMKKGIRHIADGTNHDDLKDYRPGLRAAREYDVISPLAETGLSKEEIRHMAKDMGLHIWHKPSCSCLATRIPYGRKITMYELGMVERAEESLIAMGFIDVRVRHYGDMARIEVPASQFGYLMENRQDIIGKLRGIGFLHVTLDLKGLVHERYV